MTGEGTIDYLANEGYGSKGTDLFIGFMPDGDNDPNDVTSIYEETAPVLAESSAYNTDSVGIQVLVRDNDYYDARDKCKEAHNLLAGFRGTLPDGTYVRSTQITTTPSFIGSDEKNRKLWTAHYLMNYIATETQYRPKL